MRITWLGHGTFQFELPSGQVILMDPWTDGNPAYPKGFEIQRVDTICISHGHFDHIHDAVPLAQRFSPDVVAIFETCHWLESKGVKNTRPMNKGGSQKVGDITVTMTHAVHSCGIIDDGKIIYGGEAAGYVMRLPDGRGLYLHVGVSGGKHWHYRYRMKGRDTAMSLGTYPYVSLDEARTVKSELKAREVTAPLCPRQP